jgi:hypothetical protein
MSDTRQSGYTCPICNRTSHHPDDMREGYCGACHTWTRGCRCTWQLPPESDDNRWQLVHVSRGCPAHEGAIGIPNGGPICP